MSWLFFYSLMQWIIRLTMPLVILRRRYVPSTALAWLSVIFFLPEVGLVLYLLLGNARLARKRIRSHRQVIALLRSGQRRAHLRPHVMRPHIDPAHLPMILQAEAIGGMPILGGNSVELLADTDATIDRLVADIDAAQQHVHMVFYIFAPDRTGKRVAEALARAAERGVTCRVLADASGSRRLFKSSAFVGPLRAHGVQLHAALPVAPLRHKLARLDLRNHRKIAVIDGHIAYAGSQNIVNADYGHPRAGEWADLMGRFTGPVAAQLQMVFLEDWAFETDEDLADPKLLTPIDAAGDMPAQAVPTGPSDPSETFRRVLLAAINAAQRKLIMTTPYLVPDEPTMLALAMAADRGVEVHIVVPQRSDHPLVAWAGRSYFGRLLDAGIHLHQYNLGLLHAKTMTVDDAFALLGSANIDIRSFQLNFELSVLMYGPQIVSQMRFAQMQYLSGATPVQADAWNHRSMPRRYLENTAALLSPLL